MAEKWFEDDDRIHTFLFAVQNKLKSEYPHYDIDIDDWVWKDGKLTIEGNLAGESTCACNQRDADDWDDLDFEFDDRISTYGYSMDYVSGLTKQEFFKEVVKDLIDDIERCEKAEAENAYDRMNEDDPDRD